MFKLLLIFNYLLNCLNYFSNYCLDFYLKITTEKITLQHLVSLKLPNCHLKWLTNFPRNKSHFRIVTLNQWISNMVIDWKGEKWLIAILKRDQQWTRGLLLEGIRFAQVESKVNEANHCPNGLVNDCHQESTGEALIDSRKWSWAVISIFLPQSGKCN